ncbi:salicylate hydroxylase [Halenospora varia]|nr:salicylate hydroxylase [Halenospora varia]
MGSHPPLNILIVGSGIGGLTAAISCRRAGHNVSIFERSSLNNEIGAAIHVCPNASRGLLKWGFDPERAKFVKLRKTWAFSGKTLETFRDKDEEYVEERFGAPWYLAHRVDLHEELKRLAMAEEGVGKVPGVHLRKNVVKYDPESGTITFEDDSTASGDLIIAADGVHSKAVEAILGAPNPAFPIQKEGFINFIYRFLIPSSDILADPITAPLLADGDGRFKLILGDQKKRLIWYPCRNNEIQNMGAIFHNNELVEHEDWLTSVDKSKLVELFDDFHPSVKRVLEMATEVKQWPLLHRAAIPTWHKGRLVVIGDAAHPMLPHQGQAGAQAIEDGTALGIALSNCPDNTAETIGERLKVFERIRKNRASALQIFSSAGQDETEKMAEEAAKIIGKENVPREFHST